MTREELAVKVDWEGGVCEAITGYGLRTEHLPQDTPQVIFEAWQRVADVAGDIGAIEHWLDTGEA